jgi:glycosyltransferase involved in cell wall biosynthesis
MSATTWFEGEPGGLGRYFTEVARELSATGHQVAAVVTGDSPGQFSSGLLRVVRVTGRSLPVRVMGFYRALAAELNNHKYDVFNPHFALYVFLPMLLGLLKNCPVVFNFQGPWAEETRFELSGLHGRLSLRHRLSCGVKRCIERYVYQRCAGLVVLSRGFKDLLVEKYGVKPGKIIVLAGGCDVNKFTPGSRMEARRRLGLPEGARVVFTVRRLVKRTGVELIIKALKLVRSRHKDAILLVGGEGPLRPALELLAREMGVAEAVIFTGYISEDDLPYYYRAADVMTVPSLAYEGFGLVTVEALACGAPVIGTPVGGTLEILSGLEPKLLARSISAGSLAEKLDSVLSGENWVPGRARCREFVLKNYSWSVAAREVLAVFQEKAGASRV